MVAGEDRLTRILGGDLQARFANGDVRAGGQAHQIDGVGQLVHFVEIVDAPYQTALDVAPGAEVLHVQISDREHPRSARFIRADLGPELHPAVEGGAQEGEHVLSHGLMLPPEIGGKHGQMFGEPGFVAAGSFGDFHQGPIYFSGKPFGAALRQAAAMAVRSEVFLAVLSFTMVLPRSPQAPLEGIKTLGSDLRKSCCCSGVSLTMPQDSSGYPRVANIFPRTRKSG